MSTLQLKDALHRMVVETEDPLILRQVMAFFASLRQEEDWWNLLSDAEKNAIEAGMAQASSGKTVAHTSVREAAESILKDGKRRSAKQ